MEPKSETQQPLRKKKKKVHPKDKTPRAKLKNVACMVKRSEECFKREQAKESYLMTLILIFTNKGLLSCFH